MLAGWATLLIAFEGDQDFILILVAFFLIIPVLDAVLDAVSWVATRLMLGHLRSGLKARATAWRRAVVIAGHTLADVALAIVSLFALAWLLAFAFEWAAQQGVFGPIDSEDGAFVRGMLAAAAAAPFRDGLWLLLMLATTFAPTVVHLAFLAYGPLAVIALPGARRQDLVARLEGWDGADQGERDETVHRVATYFARGRLRVWFAAAAIVVLGPIGVGIGVHAAFGVGLWGALGAALVATADHAIDLAAALAS